ncbi:Type IV/VI secretion system protein [Pseudomonas viridiflava]|uniref:Type IV/VI secretion system protein n=3 Tax=Pseudomonas TaxID=286 RepID=A0A3M4ISV8_PSEVI|nr:Type IV/VI secretion system protein [Pseudomonas syringae pv. persicae]RMQ07848.1 Type IV/VI secretion system protein [Pseudomonas viridiflava]RMQ79745.1 Type IV/VI secretion system protein [Pseudomonas viridiflava]
MMDMQSSREDHAVTYGRDNVWPGDDMFTSPHDANLFEGLQERLINNPRQVAEKRVSIHVNPLVAAASELLAQVSRLSAAEGFGDIALLNVQLSDQIKLFEAVGRRNAIENDQLLAARYVLCTVVDEAVLNTPWGSKSDWSKISLLSRFHKETFGGEKFFQLLEKLSANPFKHLPMLELMYLCLALGFEGKYRSHRLNGHELEDIRDSLYRQIRHVRGDVSRTLSPRWQGAPSRASERLRVVPVWLVVLFTVISLAVLYCGFTWVLGEQREVVLKSYQSAYLAALELRS